MGGVDVRKWHKLLKLVRVVFHSIKRFLKNYIIYIIILFLLHRCLPRDNDDNPIIIYILTENRGKSNFIRLSSILIYIIYLYLGA